jgi:hypothetical protein
MISEPAASRNCKKYNRGQGGDAGKHDPNVGYGRACPIPDLNILLRHGALHV